MDNMSHITDHTLPPEGRAVVVSHEVNRGYGAAIRSCFNYAKERDHHVMVILDGDWQHDPSYIPDFIEAAKTGKADVVIGSRFLEKNKTIPEYRIVGVKVLNMFTGLAPKVGDIFSCSRVSRRVIGACWEYGNYGFPEWLPGLQQKSDRGD